jgi:cytochrome c
MFMNFLRLFVVILFGAMLNSNAIAAGEQTRDDAITFVNKATDYIKQNGKDKALAEFNNPQGQFVDRELYIVALDMNGVVLASGANPKLAGKPLLDIKDQNGKAFVREQVDLAKSKGKGWVEFVWVNPVTKKMEPRSVYLERIGDYFILSGVFNAK